jgi:putative ABC transport system substrate-binding protein
MRRREFLGFFGAAAATGPLTVRAQPVIPVVGFLHYASRGEAADLLRKFQDGLSKSGFTEGRNVVIEYRWAEGQGDRLPSLVADLANRQVAVILAASPPVAQAVKAATLRIPTVFTSGTDPVRLGLVASLNRPGGNMTGVYIFATELEAKRLGLLHEMVPRASRIAVLVNPGLPSATNQLEEVHKSARALGLSLHVQNATSERDFDAAFASFVEQGTNALTVLSDPFFFSRRERLIALAARHALPAIYEWSEFAKAGGLMSYGADIGEGYRQAGGYTGRILKGEKPADLPVMQSAKFEMAINVRTAKALGLTIPADVLSIADQVFE